MGKVATLPKTGSPVRENVNIPHLPSSPQPDSVVEWKLWLTFETIPTDEVMHGDIDVEVEIDKTMSDKGKISPVIFFSDYDLLLDIANLP